MVRPLLFRTISVAGTGNSTDISAETLLSRPDLARHVRILHFGEYTDDAQRLSDYLAVLPDITSLKLMSTNKASIGPPSSLSILKDYRLQSLSIGRIHFYLNDILALIPPLQKIEIFGIYRSRRASWSGLESLLVRSARTLKTLCMEDGELLDMILVRRPQVSWPQVYELGVPWTPRMLRAFPNVRNLYFPPAKKTIHYNELLDSNMLPQLNYFYVSHPIFCDDIKSASSTHPKRRIRAIFLDYDYRQGRPMPDISLLLPFVYPDHFTTLTISLGNPPDFRSAFASLPACHALQHLGLMTSYSCPVSVFD